MSALTNYVLIDYENVQPTDLAMLTSGPFKVRVFLGPHQAKVPVALAETLQKLGANAEYVRLHSPGSNAVDFHIAYYIGVLSSQDSPAFFHIISKDTDFDPLIENLKDAGVFAHRSTSIASIPYFQPATPCDAQIATIDAHLAKLKTAKPRTVKALLSTLHALFKKELSEHQLAVLFASLCKRGIVKCDGAKVTYALRSGPANRPLRQP